MEGKMENVQGDSYGTPGCCCYSCAAESEKKSVELRIPWPGVGGALVVKSSEQPIRAGQEDYGTSVSTACLL